jgi:hypothetical protein
MGCCRTRVDQLNGCTQYMFSTGADKEKRRKAGILLVNLEGTKQNNLCDTTEASVLQLATLIGLLLRRELTVAPRMRCRIESLVAPYLGQAHLALRPPASSHIVARLTTIWSRLRKTINGSKKGGSTPGMEATSP